MTNDDAHSALVRWIALKTGAKTIKTHQSGKAPTLPYIAVNLLGTSEVRQNEQVVEFEETTGDVTGTPVIETEWRFSVHAYGASATDILRPIVSAQKLAQVTEPLLPGLIVFDLSQIRNIPEWINNGWEPRAQIDINLRGLTRDGFIIDTIEYTTFNIERRA